MNILAQTVTFLSRLRSSMRNHQKQFLILLFHYIERALKFGSLTKFLMRRMNSSKMCSKGVRYVNTSERENREECFTLGMLLAATKADVLELKLLESIFFIARHKNPVTVKV